MKYRRFDVMAVFTMLECLSKGMPEDQAKGEGIWLAKVIASRQFGAVKSSKAKSPFSNKTPGESFEWKSLSGIQQTDKVFDHDIIERMGIENYQNLFLPKVKEYFEKGWKYKETRDQVLEDLKEMKQAA